MDVDDNRARLIENIHLQRHGFRGLGSPFYDSLGAELATSVLDDGPAWNILAPFAGARFEDAYILRLFAGIHRAVLEGSAPQIAAHFPSTGGDGDATAAMVAINEMLADPPEVVRAALTLPPQTK